jgi:signal-transduction protein with cAMP-binding, CBS, and nucleotidyltransferase domain
VRHEPAGRVVARRSRLREGLRLRARQGRLVRQRAPQGVQAGFSTHHRRRGAAGSADLRPVEKIGVVRERVRKMGWDRCVVVNKERVVLGLLREKELSSDPKVPVEEAMRNGPATFRPNEPVGNMAKRMEDREATAVLVTMSDGRLVGLLYREDAEQLAGVQT